MPKISNIQTELLGEILLLRTRLKLCSYIPSTEGCANGENKTKLAAAYQKAVKYPDVMNDLIGDALDKYDSLRGQTKSAAQVSQIADEQNAELMRIMVVQNQRIIELLEILAKQKR